MAIEQTPAACAGSVGEAEPLEVEANGAEPLQLVSLGSLLDPALNRAERRRAGTELPVPLPWDEYSAIMGGGLWPGAHFLVSGTGVGKSQMTLQTAIGAARVGVPTVYIGLELDEAQIALRALGIDAGIGWSSLYLGHCTPEVIARARHAAGALCGLPLYVDFGPPRGWPISRLYALAQATREKHPRGPMLIVLDFLQLVGDEPNEFERRPDLRERIGGAAYAARDVARRFDASVQIVSSAARQHYGLLAGNAREAGLSTVRSGYSGPIKTIRNPSALIGLGKESGELEFAGDSVTVLIKWPSPLENGQTAIVCAVPKLRWGAPRWCSFSFGGHCFEELRVDGTDELPAVESDREVTRQVRESEREKAKIGKSNARREALLASLPVEPDHAPIAVIEQEMAGRGFARLACGTAAELRALVELGLAKDLSDGSRGTSRQWCRVAGRGAER